MGETKVARGKGRDAGAGSGAGSGKGTALARALARALTLAPTLTPSLALAFALTLALTSTRKRASRQERTAIYRNVMGGRIGACAEWWEHVQRVLSTRSSAVGQ